MVFSLGNCGTADQSINKMLMVGDVTMACVKTQNVRTCRNIDKVITRKRFPEQRHFWTLPTFQRNTTNNSLPPPINEGVNTVTNRWLCPTF